MKVLIVGVGAQGSLIATEMVKNPEVSEVRLSDIDLKKAELLAERLKSKKVRTYRVDANKVDDVMRAAREVNVLVNATTCNAKRMLNKYCSNLQKMQQKVLNRMDKKDANTPY